jgi:hypothetical protein
LNTTLSDITGLTANLAASKTYRFEAILYTKSDINSGVKFAISGTATAATVIYEAITINDSLLVAQTRAHALDTPVGNVTAVTAAYCKITGTIILNGTGTLTVQFAQNLPKESTSSVLVGSTFVTTEIDNPL